MHVPVLLQEVITGLRLAQNATVIDGTVGGGGHTRAILQQTAPHGVVIGFDRDTATLQATAQAVRADYGERFIPLADSYAALHAHADVIAAHAPIMGITLDLGLSSLQLADTTRGFSFQQTGPLDMRFDQRHGQTAADLLNSQPEEELRRIFWEYGEIAAARRLVSAMVARRKQRPFVTTADVVEVVEQCLPRLPRAKIHPATRVFQALRIAVNSELQQLEEFLPQAVALLAPGGRLAIISFHSLEDRIVKQFFRREATGCICPPEIPECRCRHSARLKLITKKPLQPTQQEINANPRSRSSKLRLAEKI